MTTAWANLVSGSTLTTGTAWDHLEAQGGGGETVYVDLISGHMTNMALSASTQTDTLDAGIIDSALSASVSMSTMSANIITQGIGAEIVDTSLSAGVTDPILTANFIEVTP